MDVDNNEISVCWILNFLWFQFQFIQWKLIVQPILTSLLFTSFTVPILVATVTHNYCVRYMYHHHHFSLLHSFNCYHYYWIMLDIYFCALNDVITHKFSDLSQVVCVLYVYGKWRHSVGQIVKCWLNSTYIIVLFSWMRISDLIHILDHKH